MLDRTDRVRRLFRYLAKLSAELKWGKVEVTLQGGIPTLTRFEEQIKPEDWPQASDSEMGEILQGEDEKKIAGKK